MNHHHTTTTTTDPSYLALRMKAVESLLIETEDRFVFQPCGVLLGRLAAFLGEDRMGHAGSWVSGRRRLARAG